MSGLIDMDDGVTTDELKDLADDVTEAILPAEGRRGVAFTSRFVVDQIIMVGDPPMRRDFDKDLARAYEVGPGMFLKCWRIWDPGLTPDELVRATKVDIALRMEALRLA